MPLPALPKGSVRLAVVLDDQSIAFVQTLLVLPSPCAQEMVLLWASLLQTCLATAAQLQQRPSGPQPGSLSGPHQAGPADAADIPSSTPRGSLDVGSSDGSGWTSQDSNNSAMSGSGSQAAAEGRAAAAQRGETGTSQAGPAAGGRPSGRSLGSTAVSPADVQAVWHKQYMPVLTDIAYLLATHQNRAAVPTAGIAGRASVSGTAVAGAAAAQSAAASNIDTPEFKSMVTQLVQFLAANGMWAVLQLITDSVYGVGASAKALYTAKASAPATPSVAASPAGTTSSAGGSGRGSLGRAGSGSTVGSGAAVASPGVIRHPAHPEFAPDAFKPSSTSTSSASSDRSGFSLAQQQRQRQQLTAGDAVAAAVSAARAGQVPGLRAVCLLLFLVLKASLTAQGARLAAGMRQALGWATGPDAVGVLKAAGVGCLRGLMWLRTGIAWLVHWLFVMLMRLVRRGVVV